MRNVAGSLSVAAFLIVFTVRTADAVDDKPAGPAISHAVYFALKDNSPEAKKKMVEATKKHLAGIPGIVSFRVGVLAEDYKRRVNDRDFDVAITIVFQDKAALDGFDNSDSHKQFVKENSANWKKVRAFDVVVENASGK